MNVISILVLFVLFKRALDFIHLISFLNVGLSINNTLLVPSNDKLVEGCKKAYEKLVKRLSSKPNSPISVKVPQTE